MINSSTNINKGNNLTEQTEHKKTTTCDVRNPGSGLEQAQTCISFGIFTYKW